MKVVNDAKRACHKGLTLIEITLVLALLVGLAAISIVAAGGMDKWKKGKAAAEQLRVVYIAQKTYMADHPTEDVSDLTDADLIPYLPNGLSAIPTITKLDGSTTSIEVDVMPPEISGSYDPSGSSDDGLWDVGTP